MNGQPRAGADVPAAPGHAQAAGPERLDRSKRSELDRDVSTELLRSERLRTSILAGLFAFGALFSFLSSIFFEFRALPGLGSRTPGIAITISFAIMTVYELGFLWLIGRRLRAGSGLPGGIWYGNALIEISLPTALILFAALDMSDPLVALSAPPLLVYVVFIMLAALRLDFRTPLFTGVVAGVQYFLVARYLVREFGSVSELVSIMVTPFFYAQRAVILAVTGVAAGFVAREMRRRLNDTIRTIDHRNEVMRVFGQQTSPEIVDELLSGRADGATRRTRVCVMFLDLRGFTTYSETREPEEVVDYLNTLFDFMIDSVNRHHGSVHQLLGDGFMAVFGVPASHGNDEQNALDAALEIIERVDAEEAAGRIPPTRVGIGLHAGLAVVGTVGSAIHREYKVTGDTVNVASRIEQMNKQFDSRLLVSGAIWQAIDSESHEPVERGAVDIRGRSGSIRIIQLA